MRVEKIGLASYAETLQDEAKRFERPKSDLKRSTLKIFFVTGLIAVVMGIAMLLQWLISDLVNGTLTYASYQDFVEGFSGSLVAMIPAGYEVMRSESGGYYLFTDDFSATTQNTSPGVDVILTPVLDNVGETVDVDLAAGTSRAQMPLPVWVRPAQVGEMVEKDGWDLTLFTCNYDGSIRLAVRCGRAEAVR